MLQEENKAYFIDLAICFKDRKKMYYEHTLSKLQMEMEQKGIFWVLYSKKAKGIWYNDIEKNTRT